MSVKIEKVGARLYFLDTPFAAKDRIKDIGAKWDADRRAWWVGAAKLTVAEKIVAELNDPTAANATKAENLNEKRVYAKVTHNDRTYFVIGQTMTQPTATQPALPLRVRLVAFADNAEPFWAEASACQLVKEYHGRDDRGAYGKPTGRTVYTTLGSLRSFAADQKAKEASGVPQCAECHVRSKHLIEDLEDGLMKCRKCCDIPSE